MSDEDGAAEITETGEADGDGAPGDDGGEVPDCGTDEIPCDGACVELGTDANCASCGHTCDTAFGGGCIGGSCEPCAVGLTWCAADTGIPPREAGCFDLATEESRCGSCAARCQDLEICVSGGCECTETVCGGLYCVDTDTDVNHCGNCTTYCQWTENGEICADGECTCEDGFSFMCSGDPPTCRCVGET